MANNLKLPAAMWNLPSVFPFPRFSHIPNAQLSRWQRRDGFEADNADKIFESTYKGDKHKKEVHKPKYTDLNEKST